MNILNLIQSQLSPQAIKQISGTIGESPEKTSAAMGMAIPAVLGSLLGKVNASPDGATQVFNAMQQDESQGGLMNSLSGILGGGGTDQIGISSILNSLLGSKLGGVSNFIASQCGIKGSSAMSILSMAAPLVMGTLAKHVTSQGLGAADFGELLNSQAEHVKGALPPSLANTLGIGSMLSGSHDTTSLPTENAPRQQGQRYTPSAAPQRSSSLTWAVPVAVVAALAIWAFSHRSNTEAPAAGGTSDSVQRQTGHAAGRPDLSRLNLPPGSIAEKVAKAISSGAYNQKIDLEGLNFDGSGRLPESANAQVEQLAAVLKAAPNASIAFTAYGSTQQEGLSKANSLKSTLVSAGVSDGRVLARGATGTEPPNARVMQ